MGRERGLVDARAVDCARALAAPVGGSTTLAVLAISAPVRKRTMRARLDNVRRCPKIELLLHLNRIGPRWKIRGLLKKRNVFNAVYSLHGGKRSRVRSLPRSSSIRGDGI